MTRPARRLLYVIAAGVAVFAAVSVYGDVSKLGQRLAGFAWWRLGVAMSLALTNYAIRFGRWSLYLRRRAIAVPPVTSGLVFTSGFALSVTPGKVGELIKSYLLRATSQVPMTDSVPVVVAERVTDLIALLLLGLVGVAAYGVARTTVLVGIGLVAVGLVVLAWPRLARSAIKIATWPRRLRRLRPRLHLVYGGLAELVRPGPLAWGSALGVLAWLAECIGFAVIVGGFPGAAVPLGLAILIYASTTVAGALSFLPGGLLVTEAGMTLLLVESSRGVDQASAAAATIITRLATLWFAVALGVVALALLRRHEPRATLALSGQGEGEGEGGGEGESQGEGAAAEPADV